MFEQIPFLLYRKYPFMVNNKIGKFKYNSELSTDFRKKIFIYGRKIHLRKINNLEKILFFN